jgi:hypothetical protein
VKLGNTKAGAGLRGTRTIGLVLLLLFLGCQLCSRAHADDPYDPWLGNGNPDPKALTYGLYFADDVPLKMRKAIVDDLVWLYSLGTLKSSGRLNQFRKISPAGLITGAELVSWLLARTKVVLANGQFCIYEHGVIVNGSRPGRPPIVFPGERRGQCIVQDEQTASGVSYHRARASAVSYDRVIPADTAAKELYGVRLDDKIMMFTGGIEPITGLSLALVSDSSRFLARAQRLETLFHEAIHAELIASHKNCSGWDAEPAITLSGDPEIIWLLPTTAAFACDSRVNSESAYTMGALVTHVLADNCSDCTGYQTYILHKWEAYSWSRMEIPLRAPIVLPGDLASSSTQGLNGRKISSAPPLMMFEALESYYDDRCKDNPINCSSKGLAELRKIKGYFELLNANKQFDGIWDGSAPDDAHNIWGRFSGKLVTSGREADEWIKLVPSAENTGYNLPMKWIRPCSDFTKGCQ